MNRISFWTYLHILMFTVAAASHVGAVENLRLFGSVERLEMSAELVIHEGENSQSRSIEVLYDRSSADGYRLRSRITAPGFLRSMQFLVVQEDGHPNTWVKTSRGVRRIAEQGTSEPVFQSDFVIQDFYGWNLEDASLRELEGDDPRYTRYHAETESQEIRFTIDNEYDLISEIEFLADNGEIERHYSVHDFQRIDDLPFPHRARMETTADGTYTELTIESVTTSPRFGPRTFNPAGL